MRAAWYQTFGPAADVLQVGEIDTPAAGPGEVLVRLHASGINPSDTKKRAGSFPSLLDDGFVLQSGYFVIPEKLELIARWSRIAGDSGTLGLVSASSDEFGAGFVWYFRGHNAKLTFDANRFNGAPVSSSRLDLLPSDAGWLFRTQFQLAF